MLKILGRVTSINVRKVLWVLDELGIAYEREDWGLPLRDPKVPEFLKLNPNGQVPVLVEDGFVLWESGAVMRYLSKHEGGALMPSDSRQRAIADQWLTWQATELSPHWVYPLQALVRKNPAFNDSEKLAKALADWTAKMRILENQLAGSGSFATGERFTLADIALGVSVHRWFETPFERPDLPAVRAYYDRLRTRPAAEPYLTAATP